MNIPTSYQPQSRLSSIGNQQTNLKPVQFSNEVVNNEQYKQRQYLQPATQYYSAPDNSQFNSIQAPNQASQQNKILKNKNTESISPANERVVNNISQLSRDGKIQKYNPLSIPPDWNFAMKHALARRVGKEASGENKELVVQLCPCCGYEIERLDLDYWGDVDQLSFLGAGFPLFYNYVKYCIAILLIQLMVTSGYDLITNILGGYCAQKSQGVKADTVSQTNCPKIWELKVSIGNKLGNLDQIQMSYILEWVSLSIIMFVLIAFRRSQNHINELIDSKNCTPADYTIMVKNIPKNLPIDYKCELAKMFEQCAVLNPEKPIQVANIVLVYDIDEIIELEENLDELVKKKQQSIIDHHMDFDAPQVQKIDEEIEQLESKIKKTTQEIQEDHTKFAGIAFIQFQKDYMKDIVLEDNQHTLMERFHSYLHKGKAKQVHSDEELTWQGQKLFIEQAPEANDIDWEFIHVSTDNKIEARIRSWGLSLLFMSVCFVLNYSMTLISAKQLDIADREAKQGTVNPHLYLIVNVLSFAVGWYIVLFNKFVIGKVIHLIVDTEKISCKTKFNISFAFKLTIALFLNTAVISFLVDIVIFQNIIGSGGFIQNETQVFILNAFFPPIVWIIDPFTIVKNWQRGEVLRDPSKCVLTQDQANQMMENVDYQQAKRYADIMKTMWFSFLFGSLIPAGMLFSILGLIIYYFADKYNVFKRRTIKENLSKELSIEMIELLETILLMNGFGRFIVDKMLLKLPTNRFLINIGVAVLYMVLPLEELTEWLFQPPDIPEEIDYKEAEIDFDTNYDRENPVTRQQAILRHQQLHQQQYQKKYHHDFQKEIFEADNAGYNRVFGYNKPG